MNNRLINIFRTNMNVSRKTKKSKPVLPIVEILTILAYGTQKPKMVWLGFKSFFPVTLICFHLRSRNQLVVQVVVGCSTTQKLEIITGQKMKIDQRIKEEMVYIYVDRITYYDLAILITYRFRRKKTIKRKMPSTVFLAITRFPSKTSRKSRQTRKQSSKRVGE